MRRRAADSSPTIQPRQGSPAAHSPDQRQGRWTALLVAALTLLALLLRLHHLTLQSFTMDEGFSAFMGYAPFPDFVARLWRFDLNMAPYHLLLRLWMCLGHSEFVIRLLSVLVSAATVPVVYWLGKRLFDRTTALVACLLLALHPFHVMLAQRARSYPLVVLLVCLASLFFLRMLDSPTRMNWSLYAVLSVVAVYTHFFAVLVVLAQWLSLLLLRGRPIPRKALIRSATLMLVLLIPLGSWIWLHRHASNISWIAPLDARELKDLLTSLTLAKFRCLAYIATWAVAIYCALRSRWREGSWSYWFTALWLFLPPVLTILASFALPLLVERYLAICIPAGVLLAAAGLTQIRRWSAVATYILLALILLYSFSNIRHYYRHPDYGEEWREASAYLLSRAQPGDRVVMLGGLPYFVFDYYRQINPRQVPDLLVSTVTPEDLSSPLPRNVWFVASTRFNPEWKIEPGMFLERHKGNYCPVPPQPESTNVKVWQFRWCGSPQRN